MGILSRKAALRRCWGRRCGQNVKSFTLKVFKVMGKALSGELSCTRTGLGSSLLNRGLLLKGMNLLLGANSFLLGVNPILEGLLSRKVNCKSQLLFPRCKNWEDIHFCHNSTPPTPNPTPTDYSGHTHAGFILTLFSRESDLGLFLVLV